MNLSLAHIDHGYSLVYRLVIYSHDEGKITGGTQSVGTKARIIFSCGIVSNVKLLDPLGTSDSETVLLLISYASSCTVYSETTLSHPL